jgi:hypothetical protein
MLMPFDGITASTLSLPATGGAPGPIAFCTFSARRSLLTIASNETWAAVYSLGLIVSGSRTETDAFAVGGMRFCTYMYEPKSAAAISNSAAGHACRNASLNIFISIRAPPIDDERCRR